MTKIGSVKNGWRLMRVLYVEVAGASFNRGKLPRFEPSVSGASGTVITQGGWRGGESWQSVSIPGPWGLPGVV